MNPLWSQMIPIRDTVESQGGRPFGDLPPQLFDNLASFRKKIGLPRKPSRRRQSESESLASFFRFASEPPGFVSQPESLIQEFTASLIQQISYLKMASLRARPQASKSWLRFVTNRGLSSKSASDAALRAPLDAARVYKAHGSAAARF